MNERDVTTRLHVWGPSVAARVAVWTLGVCLVAVAVGAEFLKPWTPGNLFVSVVGLAGALFFVQQLGTGRIELYPDVVVLDGWLRSRREIPVETVRAVEPGPYGLFFRTGPHEGVSGPSSVGARGLGLALLRVRVRGDRIADGVMAESRRANAGPTGP